jgi:hypothetical protein
MIAPDVADDRATFWDPVYVPAAGEKVGLEAAAEDDDPTE